MFVSSDIDDIHGPQSDVTDKPVEKAKLGMTTYISDDDVRHYTLICKTNSSFLNIINNNV